MQQKSNGITIGKAAREAGVAPTTLRFYEREGILDPTIRTDAGYRLYDEHALERLYFIRAAQAVGFTLEDVRSLLQIDGRDSCKDVQKLIERRLTDVETKLANLKRVRVALVQALERCRRSRKGCAVLAQLKQKRGKGKTR